MGEAVIFLEPAPTTEDPGAVREVTALVISDRDDAGRVWLQVFPVDRPSFQVKAERGEHGGEFIG